MQIFRDIVAVLVLVFIGGIIGITLGLRVMVDYTKLSTPLVEKTEYVFTQP